MTLDITTAALVIAVLGYFYQLITSYRRKYREWTAEESRNANRKKKKKVITEKPTFGSFSNKPWDWVIGGVGCLMIAFGALVYTDVILIPGIKSAWWAPTAVGILLFSWFFH